MTNPSLEAEKTDRRRRLRLTRIAEEYKARGLDIMELASLQARQDYYLERHPELSPSDDRGGA